MAKVAPHTWTFRAQLVNVVDGDTFDCDVDLGFRHWIHGQRFRLSGVDTPERGQPEFHAATERLAELLARAADSDGWLIIASAKTGKYGRWLATIEGVNEEMAAMWPAPEGWE